MQFPTIEQLATEQPREVNRTQTLDWALYYTKQLGWAIFPAHPANKRPLTTHGFKDATSDTEQIFSWYQKHANALIACPTGENIKAFVLDLDVKRDPKTGESATLEQLFQRIEHRTGVNLRQLETWIARTPTGGLHIYLSPGDQPMPRSSTHTGGMRRIDVRGHGGYIILPPSVMADGRAYGWIKPPWSSALTQAPSGILEAVHSAVTQATPDAGLRASPGGKSIYSRPVPRWTLLARDSPPCTEQEIAKIRSMLSVLSADCSREEWIYRGMELHSLADGDPAWEKPAFDLWDEWSRTCPERYDARETIRQWKSFGRIFVVRPRTIGSLIRAAKETVWTPAVLPVFGEARPSADGLSEFGLTLHWYGEIDPSAKRSWLYKGLIPTTGVGLLSGQWGTGKTFVALDLAIATTTGMSFAGRTNRRKGGVLYIAAEGASEIPVRLNGLIRTKLRLSMKVPFAWLELCPPLLSPSGREQIEAVVNSAGCRMEEEFGVPLALVVVDTMSAAANFKDENSSAEGQQVMNALAHLSKTSGAFVLAVDHLGKVAETGTRGTSAKEAAADVVIACLADRAMTGTISDTRIAVRKLRAGATGAETAYILEKVNLGTDEDGEPVTTCVVNWSAVTIPAGPAGKADPWSGSKGLLRTALISALRSYGSEQRPLVDGPPVRAVEIEKVRNEYYVRSPIDGSEREKESRRKKFKRTLEAAQAKALIEIREIESKSWVWLTDKHEAAMGTMIATTGTAGHPTGQYGTNVLSVRFVRSRHYRSLGITNTGDPNLKKGINSMPNSKHLKGRSCCSCSNYVGSQKQAKGRHAEVAKNSLWGYIKTG